MNTQAITRTLRQGGALVATLLAAVAVHAAPAAESSQDTYRRVVLGDSTIAAPQAAAEAAERVVPGSYGRYMIQQLGRSEADALAIARDAGETPTVQRQQSAATEALTGYKLYGRVMGLHSKV